MMQILIYSRINSAPVQRQFDKTVAYLQQGDFRSADVRKMKGQEGYYRARLDDTNRLLFTISEHEGKKYLFLLEVILNHAYEKSSFLRGAVVNEEKLKPIHDVAALKDEQMGDVDYINPNARYFTFLDRIITFDDEQSEILQYEPPMLLLGAAGSGKTVLALERMRQMKGDVLYVTLSSALAASAKRIYEQGVEAFEGQNVCFASLDDLLRVMEEVGKQQATFYEFKKWFERIRHTVKIKEAHKLFEEIRGVLTGAAENKPWLSREEYMGLGVRQSVFSSGDRELVYGIFERYLGWLKTEGFYDPNIVAQTLSAQVNATGAEALYDFLVVDEVQDMTNVQLAFLLRLLRRPDSFILCGDANQVVHPNFFSWTGVKRLLHQRGMSREIVRLLPGNYRNHEMIVKLSNRLLALKNVRFGSLDRESNVLAEPSGEEDEEKEGVRFMEANPDVIEKLKYGTVRSPHIAVIVLREEDKPAAKEQFDTPMVFSVQEAKGLEFPYVILYNIVSDSQEQFANICEGVAPRNLNGELTYSRPKDKEDRSMQPYLFYINALYVAMTRASVRLFILEREGKHRLLTLLGVKNLHKRLGAFQIPYASSDEWKTEADRLERFGRKEQADAIKAKYANIVKPPWDVTTYSDFLSLRKKVYDAWYFAQKKDAHFNVRDKAKLYEYLLTYPDIFSILTLFGTNYAPVRRIFLDEAAARNKMLAPYKTDQVKRIEPLIKKYGPNYKNEVGLTPLMLAAQAGATNIATYLMLAGADPTMADNWGRNAFHHAILKAWKDPQYAEQRFQQVADIVRPPYQMVKCDPSTTVALQFGTMDYCLLCIIFALQREFLYLKKKEEHAAIHVDDFVKFIQLLPASFLPANQRKKEYIHSFMAKHESRQESRTFLLRLRKGYYTLLMHYEIYVDDDWIPFHELLDLATLKLIEEMPGISNFVSDFFEWAKGLGKFFEEKEEKKILLELEKEEASLALPDDNLRDWPA